VTMRDTSYAAQPARVVHRASGRNFMIVIYS